MSRATSPDAGLEMAQTDAANSRHDDGEDLIRLQGIKKHYPVTTGLVLQHTVGWSKPSTASPLPFPQGKPTVWSANRVAARHYFSNGPHGGASHRRRTLLPGQTDGPDQRAERKQFQASIQAVFQDPWSSLNPRMRVESIVSEPLTTHHRVTKGETQSRVNELLEVVGLHSFHGKRYPTSSVAANANASPLPGPCPPAPS